MKLFLENFQEGREDGTKGRSRRLTLGETSSQEIINSKQTKQSEPERRSDGEGSKSWIIGSESRLRSPLARRHSLNLKRRCGIMKMWPLINIWGAKQVGWHAPR